MAARTSNAGLGRTVTSRPRRPNTSNSNPNASRGFNDPVVDPNKPLWPGGPTPIQMAAIAAAAAAPPRERTQPFLTSDQLGYYNDRETEWEGVMGVNWDANGNGTLDVDANGNLIEGLDGGAGGGYRDALAQYDLDNGTLKDNDRHAKASNEESMVARGIFGSSIMASNINDIVAQTKMQQDFLDARLKNAQLARDAAIRAAYSLKDRTDKWKASSAAKNADDVEAGIAPNPTLADYAPRPTAPSQSHPATPSQPHHNSGVGNRVTNDGRADNVPGNLGVASAKLAPNKPAGKTSRVLGVAGAGVPKHPGVRKFTATYHYA